MDLLSHIDFMHFLFFLYLSFSSLAATVVTQTVGQVSDQVITSREVQISMVIENILFPSKEPVKGLVEIRPGQVAFRGAVTSVLLESVLALEAENFSVANVSESELATDLLRIEKVVSGKAYWTSLEVSSAELKRLTVRKLTAKSFLKFKTNSMTSIVTDQDVQVYYDKNRAKLGGMPFESFKENIRTFLAQQQLEERIRSWFEVIKNKYKVRNFIAE